MNEIGKADPLPDSAANADAGQYKWAGAGGDNVKVNWMLEITYGSLRVSCRVWFVDCERISRRSAGSVG